jgi:hypothetical protein
VLIGGRAYRDQGWVRTGNSTLAALASPKPQGPAGAFS